MTTRMVTLDGPAGQPPRAARLDLPQGPARAAALMVQGLSAGADGPAARRIAGRLAAQGLAVLWLDLPAPETPAPEMPDATSLARLTEDLVAAAGWMAGQGLAPGVLIGHALGGAAVLGAAGRIPSARAVVTLGAPFEPALGPAIGHLHRALLVLHAPRDPVVGIEHAARIFERARHPKSFVTLDTADHLISNPQDAEYAAGVIVAWALRYLDLAAPDPLPGAPEGVVRVSEADPGGFLQDVTAGPCHHTLADEPRAMGGTDRGLSPYGFLAAALGACSSMTIRMYARRKGWPLAHVSVDVTHGKIHAEDAAGGGAPLDRFRRVIRLRGALSAAQRTRLREVADRCPVHRTLERGAEVATELAEP